MKKVTAVKKKKPWRIFLPQEDLLFSIAANYCIHAGYNEFNVCDTVLPSLFWQSFVKIRRSKSTILFYYFIAKFLGRQFFFQTCVKKYNSYLYCNKGLALHNDFFLVCFFASLGKNQRSAKCTCKTGSIIEQQLQNWNIYGTDSTTFQNKNQVDVETKNLSKYRWPNK